VNFTVGAEVPGGEVPREVLEDLAAAEAEHDLKSTGSAQHSQVGPAV
jgi:hypothetical protein